MQKKFDKREVERLSSAYTLSDMEIFIFPELFYSLVLANIMSPEIWRWREDEWFRNVEKKSFTYKINRVKQYIMDHYTFNLDLDTWGLTNKAKELARFEEFVDQDALRQSNALFGYEGDKYYFDIDIRRHFGLDKYTDDIIPYWKTETVEAMGAFKYKEGYTTGAGECVSLSSLYAAALFIVARIPLEKIYLIATPLHSQNFIAEKDGFLTNNRRILTKAMWYNGTELSAKARRAIENEKITIVSHISGYIHTMYQKASIAPEAYQAFSTAITKYVDTNLDGEILINFLRHQGKYRELFQYKHCRHGRGCFVDVSTIFCYEHSGKYKFTGEHKRALLEDMDATEFHASQNTGKILLNELEEMLNQSKNKSFTEQKEEILAAVPENLRGRIEEMFREIYGFIHTEPRLPDAKKEYVVEPQLTLTPDMSREEIIAAIKGSDNEYAKYAIYAYRDMHAVEWMPFLKAAIERNPVFVEGVNGLAAQEVYDKLQSLTEDSIYPDERVALPDEVWNFQRGSGVEKAVAMLCWLKNSEPNCEITLSINKEKTTLSSGDSHFEFTGSQSLTKNIFITADNQCNE